MQIKNTLHQLQSVQGFAKYVLNTVKKWFNYYLAIVKTRWPKFMVFVHVITQTAQNSYWN